MNVLFNKVTFYLSFFINSLIVMTTSNKKVIIKTIFCTFVSLIAFDAGSMYYNRSKDVPLNASIKVNPKLCYVENFESKQDLLSDDIEFTVRTPYGKKKYYYTSMQRLNLIPPKTSGSDEYHKLCKNAGPKPDDFDEQIIPYVAVENPVLTHWYDNKEDITYRLW